MLSRSAVCSIMMAMVLNLPAGGANAQHDSKYPDWKGQWVRIGGGQYDPSKPGGLRQAPPLTPEYKAIWESNIAARLLVRRNTTRRRAACRAACRG